MGEYLRAEHTILGGFGGMPPQEIFVKSYVVRLALVISVRPSVTHINCHEVTDYRAR